MPIETICQRCASKLRVDDRYAGSRARCPKCKTVYTVPGEPVSGEPVSGEPVDRWRLKTSEGEIYGPVPREELDRWLDEGRITPACSVQREGDLNWRPATSLYPVLQPPPENPFRDESFPNKSQTSSPSDNPFEPTRYGSSTARPRSSYRQHRGGMILTFGILGIVCCGLLAPIAWGMGVSDLKEIDAGRIDPNGRGTTQAGMVLGIIGTVLLAFQFGLSVLGGLMG